jgi:type IV secretion system protein VirB10
MDQKKKKGPETVEAKTEKPAPKSEAEPPKELTEMPDNGGPKNGAGQTSLVGTNTGTKSAEQDDLLNTGTGAPSLTNGATQASGASPLGQPGSVPGMKGVGAADDGLGSAAATNTAAAQAPMTPEEQARMTAKQERIKRLAMARSNGLSAKPYGGEDKKGGPSAAVDAAMANINASLKNLSGGQAGGMQPTSMQQGQGQGQDSEQDEKMRFIQNSGKDDRNYLPYAQQPARSRNEVKRGSYIPLRLEGGINSGQPGRVRARVTEDVYDSVTGCRLLIPAMTVVEGAYDSKVAIGQTRNLVVWNYMGFEDGSDLTLGGMQGYDSTGTAGIEADVDNHYMRLFGAAFGMSMVTAGVQLSVPSTPNGTTTQTPQQSIANALTQQYGQLGGQLLGKYLQIQPTLRNYAGERFMIMVPLTIDFKKVWLNRCGGI